MHEVRGGRPNTPKLRQRKRGIRRNQGGYTTPYGRMFRGPAEKILASSLLRQYHGQIQLSFTSPSFPLIRKKTYGNLQRYADRTWLASIAVCLRSFMT